MKLFAVVIFSIGVGILIGILIDRIRGRKYAAIDPIIENPETKTQNMIDDNDVMIEIKLTLMRDGRLRIDHTHDNSIDTRIAPLLYFGALDSAKSELAYQSIRVNS